MRVVIVGMGGVTNTFRHWPERVLGRALARRGHTVSNVGFHDPRQPALAAREETIDRIAVRRVPIRHAPNGALYRALDALGPFDVMHLMRLRNVLAYGALRWAKRRGVPTVYTWLGPFHDRYVIDDRERPYDERPKYERIVWNLAEVLRRTGRDGRLRDHLRTTGCTNRSRPPIGCSPAHGTRPAYCVRWACASPWMSCRSGSMSRRSA